MKGKKRIIIIIVGVLLVLAVIGTAILFLRPSGTDEEAEAETEVEETQPVVERVYFPPTYKLNDVEIPALQQIWDETEMPEETTSETTEPEETTEPATEPSEDPTGETDPSEPDDPSKPAWDQERISTTYVYHNFPDLVESISDYVTKLTGGMGYFVVDDEMVKQKATAIKDSEGTCTMAKTADKEGMIYQIQLTWAGSECRVVASFMPGEIKEPKRPDPEEYLEMTNSVSLLQAKEFIWSLPPSVLELDGDSMMDYKIYTMDVDVLVNGYPCIRLNIFKHDDGVGTNAVAGEYCLSRDGAHLYRIEKNSNRVKEIEIPEGVSIKINTDN